MKLFVRDLSQLSRLIATGRFLGVEAASPMWVWDGRHLGHYLDADRFIPVFYRPRPLVRAPDAPLGSTSTASADPRDDTAQGRP